MPTRTAQRRALPAALALLAVLAGPAQAQYSSPIRDVENPDRSPYQERAFVTIQTPFLNNFLFFPTPPGKRYIVEFVSLNCTTPSGSDTFPQALVNVNRVLSNNSTVLMSANAIQMVRRGLAPFGGSNVVHAGSANVKMYADPAPNDPTGGNGIVINIFHTDTTVSANCQGFVSGHTITP